MSNFNNMNISFSIIIPLYNCEKYIEKCLESVLQQNYGNYEIIVVNDGSTDSSLEIVNKYINSHQNLKVITQNNKGLSGARNTGLRNSKGDYVLFIDADDYVEQNLLSEISRQISNYDILVYGYYNDLIINDKLCDQSQIVFSDNDIDYCLNEMNILTISGLLGYAWNKAYSRKYLLENNYLFEEGTSLIEDVLFNAKVLTNTDRIAYLTVPLTHYIQRLDRMTLSKKKYSNLTELLKRGLKARIDILEKINADNKEHISVLFEFMLIYLLNYQSGRLFSKIKNVKNFTRSFYDYVDFYTFNSKIFRFFIRHGLFGMLVVLYDVKNVIRKYIKK